MSIKNLVIGTRVKDVKKGLEGIITGVNGEESVEVTLADSTVKPVSMSVLKRWWKELEESDTAVDEIAEEMKEVLDTMTTEIVNPVELEVVAQPETEAPVETPEVPVAPPVPEGPTEEEKAAELKAMYDELVDYTLKLDDKAKLGAATQYAHVEYGKTFYAEISMLKSKINLYLLAPATETTLKNVVTANRLLNNRYPVDTKSDMTEIKKVIKESYDRIKAEEDARVAKVEAELKAEAEKKAADDKAKADKKIAEAQAKAEADAKKKAEAVAPVENPVPTA